MRVIYDDGTEKDFGDEPVFIFRGKDMFTVPVVDQYMQTLAAGQLYTQAAEVKKALNEIREWQRANEKLVEAPHHKHVPTRANSEY